MDLQELVELAGMLLSSLLSLLLFYVVAFCGCCFCFLLFRQSCSVAQADFELCEDHPVLASQILELQTRAATPGLFLNC